MNKIEHHQRFSVRESTRAKRVSLRISATEGLEIVIPRGFDRERIPKIVREKEEWIRKTFEKLGEVRGQAGPRLALPETVHLKAVDRRFAIHYVKRDTGMVELSQWDACNLRVSGNTENAAASCSILKWWLQRQGRFYLTPWLQKVGERAGLRFSRVQIRGQRSRWGSCSTSGTISLNYKLLFLSPDLVDYILIHELCHTVHPNHSANYWSMVAGLKHDYKALDRRMKMAAEEIPPWAR
jgi:predicted metal-dependent hydrolase